jgi:hypothetical protein
MRARCFRTISAKKPFGFKAETLACKRDAVAQVHDTPGQPGLVGHVSFLKGEDGLRQCDADRGA